jgi:hypothetical protein
MRTLALGVMLAICGCAHNEKLSKEPAQAAVQIEKWIPVGTSLATAEHVMELHNFSCSVMTNSSFGDLKFANFLYCDRRVADSQVTPIVVRRWQVALVVADGKISAVHVNTGLIGP